VRFIDNVVWDVVLYLCMCMFIVHCGCGVFWSVVCVFMVMSARDDDMEILTR
jgi:hypothetical protein